MSPKFYGAVIFVVVLVVLFFGYFTNVFKYYYLALSSPEAVSFSPSMVEGTQYVSLDGAYLFRMQDNIFVWSEFFIHTFCMTSFSSFDIMIERTKSNTKDLGKLMDYLEEDYISSGQRVYSLYKTRPNTIDQRLFFKLVKTGNLMKLVVDNKCLLNATITHL